jgi:hypothetical protein
MSARKLRLLWISVATLLLLAMGLSCVGPCGIVNPFEKDNPEPSTQKWVP